MSKTEYTNKPSYRRPGFTFTELLIATALGLTVVSGATVTYFAGYRGSAGVAGSRKLEQDASALLELMAEDLAKAGYSGHPANIANPAANRFNAMNKTVLEVIDNMTSNLEVESRGKGSCILYSHDIDEDGVVDSAELLGFRLNGDVLQMRISGATANADNCADGAGQNWSDLTDPDFMKVDALVFDLANSECFNVREPDNIDNDVDGIVDDVNEADCYADVPQIRGGDVTVETRLITISLITRLTGEDLVQASKSRDVRVSTDWVRKR